jgi:sialidase-1
MLKSLMLMFFLQALATAAATMDFEGLPAEDISVLSTDIGTWRSQPAKAAAVIHHPRDAGKSCLRLKGGKEAAVEWVLPAPTALRSLGFELERWTRRDPFLFTVEVREAGAWQAVYNQNDQLKDLAIRRHEIPLGGRTIEAIRFRCSTPENTGVVIDDINLIAAGPMALGTVAAAGPELTPLLIRDLGSRAAGAKIITTGSENPLLLNAVAIEATGTAALESLRLQINRQPAGEPLELRDGACVVPLNRPLSSGVNEIRLLAKPLPGAKLGETVSLAITAITIDGKPQPLQGAVSRQRIAMLLRKPGDDGSKFYRIPGLATSNQGTLLAIYDIRYKHIGDLPADIDVGLSRSTDGGQTWEPMQVLMDIGGNDAKEGVGDPAILVDRKSGRIWVAALWAHNGKSLAASKPGLKLDESGQLVVSYSDDDGKTWSEPRNITAEAAPDKDWRILFNGPGSGIAMRDGTLVFAAQYWDAKNLPHSTILWSRDAGKSWHCGTGAKPDTTEAQVVELDDGSLMLNMRDNHGGSRSVAVTRDLGQTWTEHPTSRRALPEPVCQASILRIASVKDGAPKSLIAFFNPRSPKGRKDMTLQLSEDEGMTWPRRQLINPAPCWGYSCLTMIDAKTLGVLYETNGGLIFESIEPATVPMVP